MWSWRLFGTDMLHLVTAFAIYSVLGWAVESVYMSFCNRKLTNRGFGRGPYCPIYGFGAVIGYLILHPMSENLFLVYLVGAVLATTFEFIVGKLMIKFLGNLWWDYNEKPFNYKGIICLESTIAWGFYAVIIVSVLHKAVISWIDIFDYRFVRGAVYLLLCVLLIDYLWQVAKLHGVTFKGTKEKVLDKYANFKARWY